MRAEIKENKIFVYSRFEDKDRLKSIPGAEWDKPKGCRAWVYPISRHTIGRLVAAFPALKEFLPDTGGPVSKSGELLPSPKGLKTDMWTHQRVGYTFLVNLGGVGMLTMDMGTGKTLTALALHQHYGGPTLVLCPSGGGAVLEMWKEQIIRHTCVSDTLILNKGTTKQKAERLRKGAYEIVVVNYESAWREQLAETLLKQPFQLLIMDESARIKSPGGKASRFCAKLADHIPHRVALTGRPMPHSPLDIYGQMRAIDKGVFGTSFERFRQRYAVMGGYGNHQVLGYREQEEMASLLESVSYTVRSEDVQDLPEKQHIRVPVDMDPGVRAIYKKLEKDWVAMVDDAEITAAHCLTRLLRLQQITSGYVPDADGVYHITSPNKCQAAMDLIEDMAGEPVVVFCKFTHDIATIRQACQKVVVSNGELSGHGNDVAAWQRGEFQVLCVQIQSGSLAVDFTRSRYGIYYSIGYSLGDFEQSEKRLHRPGQKNKVVYYHLVTKDSVDEKIYSALTARRDVVECIMTLMREMR